MIKVYLKRDLDKQCRDALRTYNLITVFDVV